MKLMIDGTEAVIGNSYPCHNETELVKLVGIREPAHGGSTGRVIVEFHDSTQREFFPGVIGGNWIEREDQKEELVW